MARKKEKRHSRKLGLLTAIIVINGFIGFHLIINYADIKIEVLNPMVSYPIVDHTKSIYLDYPPNPYLVPRLVLGPNGTESGLPLFSLTITYNYNDTLAQGTPFLLFVEGSIYPEGQQIIDEVNVGYQDASFGDSSFRNYPPTFTAKLYNRDFYSTQIPPEGPTKMLVIKWDSEGDYYPYLHIRFKNGTLPIDVTIQDGKVHVYGLDVIQQEQFNRKQDEYNKRIAAMALDGILFPLIDLSTIGGLIWRGKTEQSHKTDPSKSKTNKSQRYDEIKRQEPEPRKKQKDQRKTTDDDSTQKQV